MSHFVSTVAELSGCRYCPMPVLRALDEGLPACVDLLPLTDLAAEITALAAGQATYTRLRNGQLAHRDLSRLADPAMSSPVHAQHACPGRTAA